MKIHSKDSLWIIILATAISLFLNIFIQSSFHRYLIANKQSLSDLELNADSQSLIPPHPAKLISESTLEENNPGPLPLELRGTITGYFSIAFIYNSDTDRSGLYKLNDLIDDYRIVSITSGKVRLDKNGITRELLLATRSRKNIEEGQAIISTDISGTMLVSRLGIISQIPKANELMTKVKILPVPDPASNKLKGFRVDNVPSGSIIEDAGIKSGDVICSVEGKKLESLQAAMQMLNVISKQPGFEVVLLRQDKPVTLKYEFRN